MIRTILKIDEKPEFFDATDALAIALCHYYKQGKTGSNNKIRSWSDFIDRNPNRIVQV
jgi:crossover junction endodeoxyribonuclease RuvC